MEILSALVENKNHDSGGIKKTLSGKGGASSSWFYCLSGKTQCNHVFMLLLVDFVIFWDILSQEYIIEAEILKSSQE